MSAERQPPRQVFVRLHPDTVERIALRVAVLLSRRLSQPGPPPSEPQLLTASEVSQRYRVHRGWVYEHAEELGAIPIGEGKRPRLRFDAAQVARRLRHPPGQPNGGPAASGSPG